MIRRLWLHKVPRDLFGFWAGEMILDVQDTAPQRVLFCGGIEDGFERTTAPPTVLLRSRHWRPCGDALNREIATRICRVRLSSWQEAEEAAQRADSGS